jgi:hypothetical protein
LSHHLAHAAWYVQESAWPHSAKDIALELKEHSQSHSRTGSFYKTQTSSSCPDRSLSLVFPCLLSVVHVVPHADHSHSFRGPHQGPSHSFIYQIRRQYSSIFTHSLPLSTFFGFRIAIAQAAKMKFSSVALLFASASAVHAVANSTMQTFACLTGTLALAPKWPVI